MIYLSSVLIVHGRIVWTEKKEKKLWLVRNNGIEERQQEKNRVLTVYVDSTIYGIDGLDYLD